jgi:putative FmdB family regulatory protein
MPIYEYKCLTCNYQFELRRAMGDIDNICACPFCHALTTKRVFPMLFLLNKHQYFEQNDIKTETSIKTPTATLQNCSFNNCGTGIKATNSFLIGNKLKMRGVRTLIDADNSEIKITDLDAKWKD